MATVAHIHCRWIYKLAPWCHSKDPLYREPDPFNSSVVCLPQVSEPPLTIDDKYTLQINDTHDHLQQYCLFLRTEIQSCTQSSIVGQLGCLHR